MVHTVASCIEQWVSADLPPKLPTEIIRLRSAPAQLSSSRPEPCDAMPHVVGVVVLHVTHMAVRSCERVQLWTALQRHVARREVEKRRCAAMVHAVVRNAWRAAETAKLTRDRSGLRIQGWFRMLSARRYLFEAKQAVRKLQSRTRGFLQRLSGAEAGRRLLTIARDKRKAVDERNVSDFVAQRKNLPAYRALVKGLRDLIDPQSRSKVLRDVLELEYRKQEVVRLDVVKEFLTGLQNDVVARYNFGEDVCVPPILLFGMPGSGKRLAAKLIFETLTTLRMLKGEHEFVEIRKEDELEEAYKKVQDGPVSTFVYFSDMEESVDIGELLKEVVRNLPRAVLVFGLNDKQRMRSVSSFCVRCEPTHLELPPLAISELAEITRRMLEQRGYRFSEGLDTKMLVDVIKDHWSNDEIASRNAHLAKIMVERVLHNKHQRQPVSFGFAKDPSVLVPADFGVSELSKIELSKMHEDVARELEAMPGFHEAKSFLRKLTRRVEFVNAGGSPQLLETCMNIVLTGNPGTGKTTFARLMFRKLRALGVLKKDVFIEQNALELKGKYVGHTAPNVRDAIRSARGGCLFLDEAYALVADDGRKDCFSGEAIRMLLTEIENHRTEVLVIMAGYKEKMGQLLVQDQGLARRFPLRINLPDYTAAELSLIAKKVAMERFSCALEDGLLAKLERHIIEQHKSEIPTQNASLAVGLVEQAVERMTCRLMDDPERAPGSQADGDVLSAADFQIFLASEESSEQERMQIMKEIENLAGMHGQKEYLRRLQKRVEFVQNGGPPALLDTCLNVVLTGNPGTGKTTFARLMFRTLRAYGVLKKDVFIERNALELKGEYCGQTAPKIKDLFKMARGGCLFLDEAYALANGDKFSNEAIRMLLTEVENNRTEVLVVLAGYEDKMEELINADPGLARRFPTVLPLTDYAPAEIAEIAAKVAAQRFDVPFDEGVQEALGAWIEEHKARLRISSHNGGLAVNLVEDALSRLAERHIARRVDPCVEKPKMICEDFGFVETKR